MNEFDRRWKLAATARREADATEPQDAPFGFATRIVAQWRSAKGELPLAVIWQRLAWRVLGGVATALALVIAMHVTLDADGDELAPDVADTIPELFWLL